MADVEFKDARFGADSGWIRFYRDERFEQRYFVEGDAIFCETILTLQAARDAVVSMLRGEWNWWDHGKLLSFRREPDGSSEMVLKPILRHITKVKIRIGVPAAVPGEEGIRLPIVYSQHLEGLASIDVCSKPGTADISILRGRFHGVRNRIPVPFVSAAFVARTHLQSEAGTLSFPFSKGTGYVGLYRRLEGK